MDEKSNRNHMTWRAPGVRTGPGARLFRWGTDGRTGQSWPRAGSHSLWKRLLSGRSRTDFPGDRGILAGGGRLLAAVPWLPEPEPRVDGRGGLRMHRGPPTGPRVREAGSPGRAAFTVQGACPPPRSSPTEGRRPRAVQVSPMETQVLYLGRAAGRPAGPHKVHRPCVPVWGARGQHQGDRVAPGN